MTNGQHLRGRLAHLEKQIASAGSLETEAIFRAFVEGLQPAERDTLRGVLGLAGGDLHLGLTDQELNRILFQSLDDDELRYLVELRGDDVRRALAEGAV